MDCDSVGPRSGCKNGNLVRVGDLDIPYANCIVLRGGDGAPAIGGEDDGPHPTLMAFQGVEEGAGIEVPELEGPVLRGGYGATAIGGKGDGLHRTLVALQGVEEVAGIE